MSPFNSQGAPKKVEKRDIVAKIQESSRPVWTARDVAEEFDIHQNTAKAKLKEIPESVVSRIKIGNTTAYHIEDESELDREEQLKNDVERAFYGEFVGLPQNPHTILPPEVEEVGGGETVELVVSGRPGVWFIQRVRLEPHLTGEYDYQGLSNAAVVRVELVEKPTVPIEHAYLHPKDDIEKYEKERPGLFKPTNNGVFVDSARVMDIQIAEDKDYLDQVKEIVVENEIVAEFDSALKELKDKLEDVEIDYHDLATNHVMLDLAIEMRSIEQLLEKGYSNSHINHALEQGKMHPVVTQAAIEPYDGCELTDTGDSWVPDHDYIPEGMKRYVAALDVDFNNSQTEKEALERIAAQYDRDECPNGSVYSQFTEWVASHCDHHSKDDIHSIIENGDKEDILEVGGEAGWPVYGHNTLPGPDAFPRDNKKVFYEPPTPPAVERGEL